MKPRSSNETCASPGIAPYHAVVNCKGAFGSLQCIEELFSIF